MSLKVDSCALTPSYRWISAVSWKLPLAVAARGSAVDVGLEVVVGEVAVARLEAGHVAAQVRADRGDGDVGRGRRVTQVRRVAAWADRVQPVLVVHLGRVDVGRVVGATGDRRARAAGLLRGERRHGGRELGRASVGVPAAGGLHHRTCRVGHGLGQSGAREVRAELGDVVQPVDRGDDRGDRRRQRRVLVVGVERCAVGAVVVDRDLERGVELGRGGVDVHEQPVRVAVADGESVGARPVEDLLLVGRGRAELGVPLRGCHVLVEQR